MTGLPQTCPVFPLAGAILLPGGALPLNIFEPRYLAMVGDAMAGERMIGMVQPRNAAEPPALHAVGGLGRITEFAETPDGRYLIVLTGITRFRILEELVVTTPYRQCRLGYDEFADDLRDPRPLAEGMRPELEQALRLYLDGQDLSADWDAVAQADDDALVRTLSAVCPFSPIEKQALLEAADLPARARMLMALMRFAPSAESPSSTLQ
jgi:Lon protease-like protein